MSNLYGYSTGRYKNNDLETITKTLPKRYITTSPVFGNRNALDVFAAGIGEITTGLNIASIDTTNGQIVFDAAHGAKIGDLIDFSLATATGDHLTGDDNVTHLVISRIVNATTVVVEGGEYSLLDPAGSAYTASLVRIVRATMPQYNASGGIVASLQFLKDGTIVNVNEDTSTPANNIPLPVKLTGITGDVTITANDLDISSDHANDSIKIGDGTNLMGVNASNEAKTNDADANTKLTTISGKIDLLSTVAKQDTVITALGALLTELQLKADLLETQPVSAASLPLPTGAATEVTLAALNAKFSSLGVKASASSAPVVLSTEQQTLLSAIKTALELIDNTVDGNELQVDLVNLGGAATEATLSTLAAEDFATQTTLAAMSAKLPAALGQLTKANSMSVTLASDQDSLNVNTLDVVKYARHDFSTSNVTDSAYTTLIADIGSTAGKKLQLLYQNGDPLYLAIGAIGSESNKFIITPGMDTTIEVAIPANSRLSLKGVSAGITIDTSYLTLNIMG